MPAVTRRDFLKAGMAGAGALAVAGLGFDVALADSTRIKQTLRIAGAKEMHSICPYCAVGCSLVAYTRQNSDGSTSWDFVLDKIAQNIKASRDATFVTTDGNGNTVNRTEGIAFAGGAAFSSEEGYFATKLMRGLGLVHLEQQARV